MKKFLCLLAVFVLVFSLAVPAFAVDDAESLGIPTPYPILEDSGYSYAYIVCDSSGLYSLYLGGSPPSPSTDASFSIGRYERYNLNNGEWVYQSSSNFGTILDYDQFVWSSVDMILDGVVYFVHDPNFFPIPLWAKVGQVTQGEIPALTQNLGGTMKILALCGVGCLASLVVLKLFGKRSLIYRN